MAKKPETSTRIADNKKAAYNYFFEERHEAGMVLEGWEVKALREGKVQLTDGYVLIRGGEMFVFADADSHFSASEGVHVIRTPRHVGILSPVVHSIPVQLLAYHTALARGTDVDKPRNLAKSVTVE